VDGFPCDEIARHTLEVVEFKGRTIGNSISYLSTRTSVAEGSKIVAITWSRRGSGITVSFLVVVMREVVECLNCVACIRMKTNAIICCACTNISGHAEQLCNDHERDNCCKMQGRKVYRTSVNRRIQVGVFC
jgi:hypothetical protein